MKGPGYWGTSTSINSKVVPHKESIIAEGVKVQVQNFQVLVNQVVVELLFRQTGPTLNKLLSDS